VAAALVLAGQGMAFGLAVNMTPPDSIVAWWVLHGALAASALAVFALLGGPLVRESVATIRAGRITVDLLFLVTLAGAFGVSAFSTARRSGPVFYELVAILLSIYTVGKLLGARSRSRALQAVEHLRSEYDACTVIDADGQPRRVPSRQVAPGDEVLVGAGEAVGVDGVVTAGEGLVETTPLTGEPAPRLAGPGDALMAGMMSVDGVFTIRATAGGGRRWLDGMLRAIEHAGLRTSRLQAAADRIAARFVPVVIAAAIGTFGFWLWREGIVAAVNNGLAVLVVDCP
jgi:cation transport ATPase